MVNFTEKDGDLIFTVRVVPRASKSEVIGAHDGTLKIRIAAPPVDGAANEELITTLAKFFAVPKTAVEITSGEKAKIKQVRVANADSQKLKQIY